MWLDGCDGRSVFDPPRVAELLTALALLVITSCRGSLLQTLWRGQGQELAQWTFVHAFTLLAPPPAQSFSYPYICYRACRTDFQYVTPTVPVPFQVDIRLYRQ